MVKQDMFNKTLGRLEEGRKVWCLQLLFPLENLNQLAHAFREVLEGEAR